MRYSNRHSGAFSLHAKIYTGNFCGAVSMCVIASCKSIKCGKIFIVCTSTVPNVSHVSSKRRRTKLSILQSKAEA